MNKRKRRIGSAESLSVAASRAMEVAFCVAGEIPGRPAVERTPDHVGDGCFHSHFILPVSGSMARSAKRLGIVVWKIRAAVVSVAFLERLRGGAENVALLARGDVEKFRLRIIGG